VWRQEDIGVGDEQRFIVRGRGRGGWSGNRYKVFVKEYRSLYDVLLGGVSIDEYESLYGSRWGVEDVGIPFPAQVSLLNARMDWWKTFPRLASSSSSVKATTDS